MHAAEHDVVGIGLAGEPRQLQRIAGQIRVLVDIGALVVVAEDHRAFAERRLGGDDAGIARVVLQRLEAVKCNCGNLHD